ncbi:uncharacterized protein F54H12.2 [Trichonephila clavipes]|nr:uncharacterized protein F54H12.2 [Trichonephila clavipes]
MPFILKDSPECVKSELELFNLPGTQTVIQDWQWKQFHPLSNVFDNAPVEFHISGSAEDYIDLSQTQLYVKAKIVKVDNTSITKDDTIGPVNLFLHSLFSQVDVSLNDRVAAVAEWYRYRIVACLFTSSSPVPLKTRRVGQRCTLNLSRAETSSRWCGVVGQMPKKLFVGCVDNEAFHGAFSKSPYEFKHFNLNFIGVYVDGQPVPHNPLELDFSKDQYIRAYQTIFVGTDRMGQDRDAKESWKKKREKERVDLSVSSRKKKTQLSTSAENSTADPENIFLPPKERTRVLFKKHIKLLIFPITIVHWG